MTPRMTDYDKYDPHYLDMRRKQGKPEVEPNAFRNGFLCCLCSVLVVGAIVALSVLALRHS